MRSLRRSVLKISEQSPEDQELIRLAVDAEAQKSIFETFRDLLPKGG